jgi:hypothetical protein
MSRSAAMMPGHFFRGTTLARAALGPLGDLLNGHCSVRNSSDMKEPRPPGLRIQTRSNTPEYISPDFRYLSELEIW